MDIAQAEMNEYLIELRKLGPNGEFVSHVEICGRLGIPPHGPTARGWEILRALRMSNWVELRGNPTPVRSSSYPIDLAVSKS